ncbi:MAG: hypothetical protein NZ781_12630 [Armatimonadetes bacterium]|nr:hypothetical protein [Armatimonadota bacterium]
MSIFAFYDVKQSVVVIVMLNNDDAFIRLLFFTTLSIPMFSVAIQIG